MEEKGRLPEPNQEELEACSIEELFERLMELKERGMTIIFISHKLNEVKRISDRITVLKGGVTKGTYLTKDVSEEDISNLMVGREISFEYDKARVEAGEVVLKAQNLTYVDVPFATLKKAASLSLVLELVHLTSQQIQQQPFVQLKSKRMPFSWLKMA